MPKPIGTVQELPPKRRFSFSCKINQFCHTLLFFSSLKASVTKTSLSFLALKEGHKRTTFFQGWATLNVFQRHEGSEILGEKLQKRLRLQTLSPSLVVGLQQSQKPMEEWHPKHHVFHIWGRKEMGSTTALNCPQHTSTLGYDWSFSPVVPRVFDL